MLMGSKTDDALQILYIFHFIKGNPNPSLSHSNTFNTNNQLF